MGRRSGSISTERMPSVIKGVRSARGPNLPTRIFQILYVLLVLAVILGLIALALLGYLHLRVKGNEEKVGGLSEGRPAEPMNVLVLGSDSRDDLTEEQRKSFGTVPGRRADTIILLHVDERREKAVLVHFPRDLRVRDSSGKVGKINAIYGQGPEEMVRTVSKFAGLPINHYIEVDFNGFNRITEALGGVDVYFEKPLKDPDSGLNVPKGCVTIEGDQALAFVRARKIDDDFGRIGRQQLYVKLMIDKIATPGTLLHPARVLGLINIFSENVKHDADLDLTDIRTIAFRVRSFNSQNVDMRVVPSQGARIDGQSFVVADETKSAALFEAIRKRTALPDYGRTEVIPLEPGDVKVAVLNGTSIDKLAKNEQTSLAAKGHVVLETANTTPHTKTTVYFREGFEEKGRYIASSYGAEARPITPDIKILRDVEVALVLGEDFVPGRQPPPGSQGAGAPAPPVPQTPPAAAQPLVHACT
jgi:LCP family protein required for cell wall assembly